MKISIIIYSDDDETIWNAFRFGVTSLIYDNDTSIFLLGKGVEALNENSLYDIQEQLDIFRENGGTLIGCGVCVESRKDEMPNIEELLACEMGSMQDLYGLAIEADKVLTF